jgi:HEAT repeat protein
VVLSGEGAPAYQPDDQAKVSEPSVKPAAEIDATAQMSAALQDPDPAVRIKALDRWAEQGAATPFDPLTQALVDPDGSVRAKAQQLFDRALAIQGGASPLPPPPALPLESEQIPTR